MTTPDTRPDVLDVARPWLNLCASCDAGILTGCTCPQGDFRAVISRLFREVQDLRKLTGYGLTTVEWEQIADEWGRTYEFDSGRGHIVGWLSVQLREARSVAELLRRRIANLEAELARAGGDVE